MAVNVTLVCLVVLDVVFMVAGQQQRQQILLHQAEAFVENTSMQPCEDFYVYTCESQHKKPDGSSISNFRSLVSEAQGNLIAKLKAIVEGNDDDAENTTAVQLMRIFYKSCMSTEEIDKQGCKPIRAVLKELGGWPIINKNSSVDANWQDLHVFYSRINVFPLYEISVNNDAFRRTHTILLRQPKLIIRALLLHRAKTFNKYVDYIKTVALTIATNSSGLLEQEVAAEAKQIAAFEAEISKILEERSDFYRPVVLKKFQNLTNQLTRNKNHTMNWLKVINKMYSAKLVSMDDIIDVSTIGYFPKLVQLLHRTPLRTIVNYIHWKFVSQFLAYTGNETRNLYFNMKNFMHDPVKNVTRWRFCGFEPTFDHVISFEFAKKHITKQVEDSIQEILSNVKKVTIRMIRHSLLFNEEEKQRAETKVASMSFVLGIADTLKNFSVISNYYKKLSLSKNYFTNVLILKRFYKTKEFEVIKKPHFIPVANKNFLKVTTISSIGSAYEFFENRVRKRLTYLIKVENLLPPLFDPDYPEYKKYGILGFIMAYEIMHAFNDADSIGIERPRKHLYSEQTRLKYWNKIECFINQYDNYYIPDPLNRDRHLYVDGGRSAMENIADSTAVQIAFRAFREQLKKEGYSSIEDDKEFFTSFASLLCRPELEEFYLSRFNFALRTLPRFRVVGSLSNTHEFARAFSCSSNARMNPETRCSFWN